MLNSIEAIRRKYGRVLLGRTQTDTDFILVQIVDIAFEYHLVGDVIRIRIPFVKHDGIALTEVREGVLRIIRHRSLKFSGRYQQQVGFMFVGCVILFNS